MTKNVRVGILAVGLLIAFGSAGAALASRRTAPQRMPAGPPRLRMAVRLTERLATDAGLQERLGLGEEQVARLRAIREDLRQALPPLKDQARQARSSLRGILRNAEATRAEIESAGDRLEATLRALGREARDRALDARDVLTVEQRHRVRAEVRDGLGRLRGGRLRREGRRDPPAPGLPQEDAFEEGSPEGDD